MLNAAVCGAFGALLLVGCAKEPNQPSAPATAAAPETASAAPATAPAATTPTAGTQASWTPTQLDELLAPIALYPDALVGQVLTASTNTQEVLDGGNWLLQNSQLKGAQLDAAAEKVGFSAAMRALLQFPDVIDMMCRQLDWTRQLGEAFTADQKAVLDSIQRLRQQAANVGNLKSTPQQHVETKKDEGKDVIVVKPADPQVVYVPQYNPEVVYTTPPPPPGPSNSEMVTTGLLAFTAGVLVAKAFDDDDYYYPHWGAGAVYVGPRPWHAGYAPYRPVYGPAFAPATAYRGNTNVVINNNNYFNRFQNNANRTEWRGRTTYAGANVSPTRTNVARNEVRPAARPRVDVPNPGTTKIREPYSDRSNRLDRAEPIDRGYARNADSAPRRETSSALSGLRDGGAAEQAASARGRASLGGGSETRRASATDRMRRR